MKKTILLATLAGSIFANDNFIEIGGGFTNEKNNFSTEQKTINSNLDTADSKSTVIPLVAFKYTYQIDDAFNLYIQNDLMSGLNLGSEVETNYGYFDFGLKADIMGEEWENPFQTVGNRKKTDTKEFGAYIGYGFSLAQNHEAMVRYEYSKKDYDKDTVQKELKRDGKRHLISLENNFNSTLFENHITYLSTLSYEKYSADGKASSYSQYDIELGFFTPINDYLDFTMMTNLGKKKFDESNPVFNKKVDATVYGVKAIIDWNEPLNYKNTYVSFKTGYDKEEANVNFYDKENTFGIVSIGYRF